MLVPHVFDRVHDDIGVSVRESRIDEDQPLVTCKDDFHTIDWDVF
jgi:hypothetical protein